MNVFFIYVSFPSMLLWTDWLRLLSVWLADKVQCIDAMAWKWNRLASITILCLLFQLNRPIHKINWTFTAYKMDIPDWEWEKNAANILFAQNYNKNWSISYRKLLLHEQTIDIQCDLSLKLWGMWLLFIYSIRSPRSIKSN